MVVYLILHLNKDFWNAGSNIKTSIVACMWKKGCCKYFHLSFTYDFSLFAHKAATSPHHCGLSVADIFRKLLIHPAASSLSTQSSKFPWDSLLFVGHHDSSGKQLSVGTLEDGKNMPDPTPSPRSHFLLDEFSIGSSCSSRFSRWCGQTMFRTLLGSLFWNTSSLWLMAFVKVLPTLLS